MVYLAEYSIWSVLREKVYRSKIADVDELKTHLMSERSLTSRSLMSLSTSSVAVRVLRAYFEHKF